MITGSITCSLLYFIVCPALTAPDNGMIVCTLGDDGIPTNRDTCTVTCNDGFELRGDATRTCRTRRNSGSWSGRAAICVEGMPNTTTIVISFILSA